MKNELNNTIKARGVYEIRHYRNGKLLSEETIDNTSTTAGFAKIAGLYNEDSSGGFKWLALDESSTTYTAASTALGAEATSGGLGRAEATNSRVTTTSTSDTAQAVKTFTATATKTVLGAGIFDTSTASAGTLSAGTHFTAKNMESDDTLQVTYKVKIS